jgi:hypothetical protein
VDVGVIHEVLTPGMQNAGSPYLCAKMFLVLREFHERLGYGSKKKIVHDLLIHQYQWIQFRGDCEDYMEVFNGQEVLIASLNPFLFSQGLTFGAVPVPAGVIRYLQMATVVAPILMAAEDSGSAYFDGAHDPQMIVG